MKTLSPKSPIRLKNRTCPYCSEPIDSGKEFDEDHVVGRRFVPKGSLQGQWCLIVNACKECNRKKSDLEDDISAITLNAHDHAAPELADLAAHKASRSFSRDTGKLVADSYQERTLSSKFAGLSIDVGLVVPPQIADERTSALAHMHLLAFYYFASYNESRRVGGFPIHPSWKLDGSFKSDWGNPLAVEFMKLTKNWDPIIHAIGASGFFKISIKRDSATMPRLWSVAIEWNQSYRTIGLIGAESDVQSIADCLPQREFTPVSPMEAFTKETPLDDQQDTLFAA